MRNRTWGSLISIPLIVIGCCAAFSYLALLFKGVDNVMMHPKQTATQTQTDCWDASFLEGKVVEVKHTTLPDSTSVVLLRVEVGKQSYPCLAGSEDIAVKDTVGMMKYGWFGINKAADANVFIAYHLRH